MTTADAIILCTVGVAVSFAAVYGPGLARAARARARREPRRLSRYGRWRLARAMRRHGVDLTAYVEDEVQDDGVLAALDAMPAPGAFAVVRDRDGVLAAGRVTQMRETSSPAAAFAVRYDTPTRETNHTDNHEENPMQYENVRVVRSEDSEHEFPGGGILRIPAAWHVTAGEYAAENEPDLVVTVVGAVDSEGNDVSERVAAAIRDALTAPAEPVKQRGSLPTVLLVASSVAAANAFLMAERDAPAFKGVNARVITPDNVGDFGDEGLGAEDHVVFVPGWEKAFLAQTRADQETPWHVLTMALAHAFHALPTWRAQIVQVP